MVAACRVPARRGGFEIDPRPAAFTREEREAARERLVRFGRTQEFTHLRAAARSVFWRGWPGRRSEDDVRRAMALDRSAVAFEEWFQLDYRLPGGFTVTDLLLDREGHLLRTGEQRYLERLRTSQIRPYEVTAVRLDEGLDLRDLWTGASVRVQEPGATHQVAQPDVLVVRLMPGAHDAPAVDGLASVLPASESAGLLRRLRDEHREFALEAAGTDLAAFFKSAAPVLFHFWLDHVALRPPPPRTPGRRRTSRKAS
jgi:hypothetical protein